MNQRIRRATIVLVALFALLVGQLTRLQVIQADSLANDSRNGRTVNKNFNSPRGFIQTSDGVLLAKSEPVDPSEYNGRFKFRRLYPEGDLYSHVVGFYSYTYGSDGVERSYDKTLRGSPVGISNVLKPLTDADYVQNVTLTLNSTIQKTARDALGGRKGSVVALNPKDGSVYAMWSFPSYNPSDLSALNQSVVRASWNALQTDPDKPMLARSFRETFPPGSTFKTVTASAALDKKPQLANKVYPFLNELHVTGSPKPIRNFGGATCGGRMPALLKVSCNTGFAQMGLDLGATFMYQQASAFGFNVPVAKQALDLPAVATSIFPSPDSFIRNSPALAKSAIGQQDVRATPLQMALVAAGIANNGTVMEPHVMDKIDDNSGKVIRTHGAKSWFNAMSSSAANQLRDMMVGVVNGGTGTRAKIPGVQVAGKTGTAQTVPGKAHAWFIGFAPADDPVVAVAVIVESQPGLGDVTGGRIAAPIAKQVMEAVLAQKSAPNP